MPSMDMVVSARYVSWMSAVILMMPRRALPFAGEVIETAGGVLSTVMDTDVAAVLPAVSVT